MGSYVATIVWKNDGDFASGKYSRAHEVSFDAPLTILASSSPHVVKAPYSRADAVDPEEMLVASLSSCHMLSFLYVAWKAGFAVDSYVDRAEGVMTKNEAGKMWMSRTTLNPQIVFSGGKQPSPEELRELHHRAHEECFIANSYRGDIAIAGGEAH
ncbi:MAG: OsmC family protein [Hyphomonadaceae bacterium]